MIYALMLFFLGLLVQWFLIRPIPDMQQLRCMLERTKLPYTHEAQYVNALRERWPTAEQYVIVPGPCDPLPIGSLWVFDSKGKLLGIGAWRGVSIERVNSGSSDSAISEAGLYGGTYDTASGSAGDFEPGS